MRDLCKMFLRLFFELLIGGQLFYVKNMSRM
nr:MAG TPA: hypothetical protein [Caudoviricetes sp.]